MKALTLVQTADLRDLWPWIAKGLEQITTRYKVDWEPDDVKAAALTGNAVVHRIGQDQGFCVLQRQQAKGRPFLYVWALWGPNELQALEQQIYDDLNEIAKSIGAVMIRQDGRDGWERRGWRKRLSSFEREVW